MRGGAFAVKPAVAFAGHKVMRHIGDRFEIGAERFRRAFRDDPAV